MFLKTTAIVTSFNILNTILHFIFGLLLAFYFGASAEMDAYVVASNFIITLNALFVQAQTKSFIPFIANYENDENKENVIASILKFNIVVFSSISFLLFLFSHQIAFLLAPGLSPSQLLLTSKCLKILAIFILFSNLSGIGAGLIQYDLKFKRTSLINFFQALLLVGILIAFVKFIGVYSIPVAHVSSIGISVFYYLYMYKKNGHIYRTSLLFYNEHIKRYLILLLPIVLASIFTWLIQYADTFIASFFDTGSISYLNYCQKIIRHVSVISNSICVIYFPILSKLNRDDKEFLQNFYLGLEKIFLIIVFLTSFILLYKTEIVRLLFERGSFSSRDTDNVSSLLTYFSFVFICSPMGAYLAGAYYSRQETKRATIYSIISSFSNIILNIILGFYFGIKGLAAASSIAFLIGNILQLKNISKINKNYKLIDSIKVILKPLLLVTFLFVVFYIVNECNYFHFDISGQLTLMAFLIITFAIYSICFFFMGYIIDIKIIKHIINKLIKRD